MCVYSVLNILVCPVHVESGTQCSLLARVAAVISSILCSGLSIVGYVLGVLSLAMSLGIMLLGVIIASWLCWIICTQLKHLNCELESDKAKKFQECTNIITLENPTRNDDFGPFEKADIPCLIQIPEYVSLSLLEEGSNLLYKENLVPFVQDKCTFEQEVNHRCLFSCSCFDAFLSSLDLLEIGASNSFKFTSDDDTKPKRFLTWESETQTTILPPICQCSYCYIFSYFSDLNFSSNLSSRVFEGSSLDDKERNQAYYKICYSSDVSDCE